MFSGPLRPDTGRCREFIIRHNNWKRDLYAGRRQFKHAREWYRYNARFDVFEVPIA
jgi:hypothetical protein